MKNLRKNLRQNLRLLTIFVIMSCFALTVDAQCIASYTYTDDGGGAFTFTNTSTGSFLSAFWDYGDGKTAFSYSTSSSHTFPYNGSYNVCLTVRDSVNSCVDVFCNTIVVTGGASTCASTAYSSYQGSSTYYFSTETMGVAPFSYSWDFGDGNTSNQSTPNHSYTQNGNYLVHVFVTDDRGCVSSDTLDVDFTCTADYTYVDNGVGNYSFYSVMNDSMKTYSWDFGDSTGSALISPTHTYANDGSYTVCLTVSDSAANCFETYCDSILVSGTGNINCSFNYGTYQSFPNGPTFSFWEQSQGSTYLWDFGDGNTSTQKNPTHTYSSYGLYNYCLTVDSCPKVCSSITAYNCESNFYHYPDSSSVYDLIVVNNAVGNNLTYLWDFGDGNTSTLQFPQHTYAVSGSYYLCLTIDNGDGCVDTFCDSINANRVNKKQGFSINIINPATTTINEVYDLISKMNIYPNPFKDIVNIEFDLETPTQVEVFVTDLLGNVIDVIVNHTGDVGINKIPWRPNGLTSGVYLLNVKTHNSLQVKKLILNR